MSFYVAFPVGFGTNTRINLFCSRIRVLKSFHFGAKNKTILILIIVTKN
jgi:hypothetical protein